MRWGALVELEAAASAVESNDSRLLFDVPVAWEAANCPGVGRVCLLCLLGSFFLLSFFSFWFFRLCACLLVCFGWGVGCLSLGLPFFRLSVC